MKALLILAIPVCEIILGVWLGRQIGGWMLLLWFVIAFFVGRQLMRSATVVLTPQLARMQAGQSPELTGELLAALCTALAGFLFIMPGVLTDAIGLLLLLPPVQEAFRGQIATALRQRSQGFVMMGGFGQPPFGGQGPFGAGTPFGRDGSQVFDGEAREVNPEAGTKRIERQ